jgi:hypothetical protein
MSVGLLTGPASADGIVVPGNKNCAQLIPGVPELRVEPPTSGTFSDGTLTVNITIRTLTADDPAHPGDQTGSQVFDFTATGGTVIGIAVKGGNSVNFYDKRPTGVTSGTGLHAPTLSGGKFAGLSHISFCYVVRANPTIVTQASAAITIGGSVTDTATLSGGNSPTGTITFRLFGPNDSTCSGTAVFTSTVTVNAGNGNYTSGSFTPTAVGTYRWTASYSGDANNNPASSPCNAANESVVVNQANPTIVTNASGNVTIGGSVTDTATLSGGSQPTGTITFNLYGPNDATCAGAAVFTDSATVSGNGNYTSDPFQPTAEGTYRWTASYSGDANNNSASSPCNAANESVDVTKNQPTLGTAPNVLPNDEATLTGLVNPSGGTIKFELFLNADCTGAAAYTSGLIPVNANGTFESTNETVLVTTDTVVSWVVTYSGDASNAGATSGCAAEQADIDFTPLAA